MSNIFTRIEDALYTARDFLWNYPDNLFFGEESFNKKIQRVYSLSRPYSHVLLAVFLTTLIGVSAVNAENLPWVDRNANLIEGVVMGVDSSGALQKLTRINPLIPSSIQIEKDIDELVYEPLIRYEANGSVTTVLARAIERREEGADYEFDLRTNVYWHDGKKFGVDDVIATLEVLQSLDTTKYSDAYVQAIKQMAWEKTGENSIRICTTNTELLATIPAGYENQKCSAVTGERPILANFLELISIKIMPAHLIVGKLDSRNIDTPIPEINRYPVGTGPYKFQTSSEDNITLVRNENYHDTIPQIKQIDFRLFRTETDAIQAITSGEIHSMVTVSTQDLRNIENYNQLVVDKSPVLDNQYWAIYFNLKKDPNGNALGPSFFQDTKVRQAISAAIDRNRVLQTLLNVGDIAEGPIPGSSEFFNANAGWSDYNPTRAASLLDEAGWTYAGGKFRQKDGQSLSFHISFIDNPDRNKIVESIRQDLATVGVELIPEAYDLRTMTEQVLTPRIFDTLLYGMSTFIDPDRYELFYTNEKLNLASYIGSEETAKVEGGKKINLPKIDRDLEQGRSFNPSTAKDSRLQVYADFQTLLAQDTPVIFLYHPQFLYYHNKRLQNVNLSMAENLEQRFRNIADWRLDE